MNSSNFDTRAAARELEAAGIDPRHVEAIVAVHRQAGEQVATKADLAAAVADLRTDLRTGLAALENRMLKAAYGNLITTQAKRNLSSRSGIGGVLSAT